MDGESIKSICKLIRIGKQSAHTFDMNAANYMYRRLAKGLLLVFDNISGTRNCACRAYLEKTQWLNHKNLQRIQLERLKGLLKDAYEKVPHYREIMKRVNLLPSDVKSMEDIRKLPILKKSEIRTGIDQMLNVGFPKKELKTLATSGTTAIPFKFYRSKMDISWGTGAELRARSWGGEKGGYEVGDKRALLWSYEPEETSRLTFRLSHFLMRDKLLNVKYMSERAMESFAERMVRFKPEYIHGYVGSTNLLATFLLENPKFEIRPKAVFTTAGTLLPNYRKTIEKAFSCRVYDLYGSREIQFISAQCGHHEGLHVAEENVIVEIVDDDDLPVSAGEEGRIILTNLHSHAMPFIRYDIGDYGKIFPESCSCGRQLSLLKPIGRTYEYFINSDGSFTYLRDFQIVFEDLPVRDFQVVQESYDEIVVKVVKAPGYTDSHTEFIVSNLKERGKSKIRVELVDSIPAEASGKAKHIVRKMQSKYA
jgi:phenylacetate-CoA ligase